MRITPTISVVLPFYKRFGLFNRVASLNSFLWDRNTEIIMVLDDPSDETCALQYASEHPELLLTVIVNDTPHDWRPPCKALNVGIRHAQGQHIAICSPENIILVPCQDYLHTAIGRHPRSLISARNYNAPPDFLVHPDSYLSRTALQDCHNFVLGSAVANMCFGFIVFPRDAATSIAGYDESRKFYGGDDADFHTRLEKDGLVRRVDPFIMVIVMDHPRAPNLPFSDRDWYEPPSDDVYLTRQAQTWGRDFNRIAYRSNHISSPLIQP